MPFELETGKENVVNIKVIGVGGGGNNVISRMVKSNVQDIDLIAVNTDKQALNKISATYKLQIGEKLTGGMGAGSDPEIGKEAAKESKDQISRALENTDMLFIAAGMGGGTGTGAAPVIAEIAQDQGILTVAVVTKPFEWEGNRKMQQAEEGLLELKKHVDALVVVPNERLKLYSEEKLTFVNAFAIADDVLIQAVKSISELIHQGGFINLDFSDVKAIMKDAGMAHMGVGHASGKGKADEAANMAISSPLLETSIEGSRGILINVTCSIDTTLDEVAAAVSKIQKMVHDDALSKFGASFDESMEDEVRITVIATGFEQAEKIFTDAEQKKYNVPYVESNGIERLNEQEGVKVEDVTGDDPYDDILALFDNRRR